MTLLRRFPLAVRQLKFIIVVVNYFTKWIEAEPLATSTAERVKKFVWKNVVYRHGLPHTIVTDSGTHFASAVFQDFCKELGITLWFASVEYTWTNEQVEAANKIILKCLGQAKGK